MEFSDQRRVTQVQLITNKTVAYTLLISISVIFGILNFMFPIQILAGLILICIAAVLLFLYPFVGLLVYQFITVVQPGVIFPALHAIHPERMLALFLIVSLIINIKLRRDRFIVRDHNLMYLIGFFALAIVISVPTSYWPGQSVDKLIDFAKTIAYFLLIINIIKTPKQLKIFVWEYLLLIGYMAVSSALAYKTGQVMEAQGIVRAVGLSGADPNSLAATLGLSMPFFFLFFRQEKNWILKALIMIIVPIAIYTIILTGSRSGFIGLGVAVVLCWWYLPNRGVRLFLMLAGAFIVFASMPDQYQQRYSTIVSDDVDASTQGRFEAWEKGLRMFTDRPFTGVGAGSFITASAADYSEAERYSVFSRNLASHSLYIELLATLGIVGFVAFMGYVAGLIHYIRKYRDMILRLSGEKDWFFYLMQALFISVIQLLVYGVFGHNLFRTNWYWYGAITICMAYMLTNGILPDDKREQDVSQQVFQK